MPTTGPLSGKYGEVRLGASSDVSELLEWSLDFGPDIQKYFSRAGAGYQQTVEGCWAGSGTITVNLDVATSIWALAQTGAKIQLNLYSQRNSPTCVAYGQCRFGKGKFGAKRSGEVQQVQLPFDTDGSWTIGQ